MSESEASSQAATSSMNQPDSQSNASPAAPAAASSSTVKAEAGAASNSTETAGDAAGDVPAEDHLTLKVTDGVTDVLFRVKPGTLMSRLINGFCKRAGKDRNSLRFLFEGERVNDEDTPKGLGMVEGDVIEVLSQQVGGSH